ncbi:hypothetical protein [Rhodoferax sp.]|uniref:InlB B-repeat-containing protein n=1 Tax=Rhodoferax sp. TaxID=50421 RepID=UPI00260477DC|nr:hypothetical protein [Rhodoferax sp.]MDD2927029.1 hypothetical protein [Rhodoferax sp.]
MNCAASCEADFASGTIVTLTAIPGTGHSFSGWAGACSGAASTCVVTMDQSRAISSVFTPSAGQVSYTLTMNVTGNGSVSSQPAGISNCTANCNANFASDTLVTLTATPAANQNFTGWSGACTGSASSCTVTLSQARTVGAAFSTVVGKNFALNVATSGNGSVVSNPAGINCGSVCSANFAAGTTVNLVATPSTGQVFASWSGACTGSQPSCVLQLTQVRTAQANFVAALPPQTFQPPQLLESSNDFNIDGSQVAVNRRGDAIAIWEQSDGSPSGAYFKVHSRRYQAATGWQPTVVLDVAPRHQNNPSLISGGHLLMDDAGVVTWIREDLETRRSSPSTGWDSAFYPPNLRISQKLTSAVLASNGNISVLRSGSDVENGVLVAGGQWGTWTRVDTAGSTVSKRAQMALSANGTALAVWRESNPGDSNYSVKAARYTPTGGWGTPESIEALFTNVADADPSVVMDDQGNGIAMWQQNVGSNPTVYSNIFRVGSGWQGAVDVAGESQALASARIQLAMTPDGRAVATWYLGGGLGVLRSMQYNAATGWTTPVTVAGSNTSRRMSMDNSGRAVMVYSAIDAITGKWDLVSHRLSFCGSWSAPTSLETAAGSAQNLEFAMNNSGQGVALWVQDDVAGTSVRKSLWTSVLR